jgi:hypothetical protein
LPSCRGRERPTVFDVQGDNLVDDIAQLTEDRSFVVPVATSVYEPRGTPDKALILV